MMDLNELSLAELKKLSKDVDRAIKNFETRKRQEARLKLETVAKEMGFSLSELTGEIPGKITKKVTPKYANPDNPNQKWTGRGRKPKWVETALANGKTLDDLAI